MVKISFITFTRNSAERIGALLENIKDVVDEIIVIDGFSSDDTVKIAKSYGAKVFCRRPKGIVELDRMFALRKCSNEWVLYLDDDERLGIKLKSDLRKLIEETDACAISCMRINISPRGEVLSHFYPDLQIRIFRRSKTKFRGIVHEKPLIAGTIKTLPQSYYILHILNRYAHYLPMKKLVTYAYFESRQRYQEKIAKSPLHRALIFLSPFSILPLYLYYVFLLSKERFLNLSTLFAVFFDFALYRGFIEVLKKVRV